MSDTITMSWTDWRGKEIRRDINLTLDIRDFEGRPGYVWLFLAANCHLSYADIQRCIELQGDEDMERSREQLPPGAIFCSRRKLASAERSRTPTVRTGEQSRSCGRTLACPLVNFHKYCEAAGSTEARIGVLSN